MRFFIERSSHALLVTLVFSLPFPLLFFSLLFPVSFFFCPVLRDGHLSEPSLALSLSGGGTAPSSFSNTSLLAFLSCRVLSFSLSPFQ